MRRCFLENIRTTAKHSEPSAICLNTRQKNGRAYLMSTKESGSRPSISLLWWAKGKKGQYFTPRHVINMAVKMMNPKPNEYVIDPAAGSGGFLISTMYWVKDQHFGGRENAMQDYAHERIWGIDFADEISKVSRALMLIAGDGRSHMFKLNSLDSRGWQGQDTV